MGDFGHVDYGIVLFVLGTSFWRGENGIVYLCVMLG